MACATERRYYTTGQLALRFGVLEWQVLQLFRRQLLPEPERLGRLRLIPAEALPGVEAALRRAGYLPAAPGPGARSDDTGNQPKAGGGEHGAA